MTKEKKSSCWTRAPKMKFVPKSTDAMPRTNQNFLIRTRVICWKYYWPTIISKAVIVKISDRIRHGNLVGMGIIPLCLCRNWPWTLHSWPPNNISEIRSGNCQDWWWDILSLAQSILILRISFWFLFLLLATLSNKTMLWKILFRSQHELLVH